VSHVCVDAVQITAEPTVFPILTKLGTHNLCANTQKTVKDFRKFDFTIFGEFFRSNARPTGLLEYFRFCCIACL